MNQDLKYYPLNEISNYHYVGRSGLTEYPLPLVGNATGIELMCTGSELWLDIDVNHADYEPWIYTEIDGAFMSRQMLLKEDKKICLYRHMCKGQPHSAALYRELQAMSEDDCSLILIKGVMTDGEFLPVPIKPHKIEFIGDSITSGEGTYGNGEDAEWLAMYMSASRNYSKLVCDALNAERHLISQGGWGVFCGWDNDVRHNIPSKYEKVFGLADGEINRGLGTQKDYDFTSWQPEAIIINLGTNDNSAFDQPVFINPDTGLKNKMKLNDDGSLNSEDAQKIKDAIVNFLEMLRKHNPTSHLVWCYGMLGYRLTLCITDAINIYIRKTGDSNVAFLQLDNTLMDEFGCRMHPGILSHKKAARVIIDHLKTTGLFDA